MRGTWRWDAIGRNEIRGEITILLKRWSAALTLDQGDWDKVKLIAFPDDKPLTSELNGSL